MSTEKVDKVHTLEETSLSEVAPEERTRNITNYGSMSSDSSPLKAEDDGPSKPSPLKAEDDGPSKPDASGGSALSEKKTRKSSVKRLSIKDGDEDVVEAGPGLDTIIRGTFIRQ